MIKLSVWLLWLRAIFFMTSDAKLFINLILMIFCLWCNNNYFNCPTVTIHSTFISAFFFHSLQTQQTHTYTHHNTVNKLLMWQRQKRMDSFSSSIKVEFFFHAALSYSRQSAFYDSVYLIYKLFVFCINLQKNILVFIHSTV